MALCTGTTGCGCALQSASLVVSGSGGPGDPWTVEGASPMRITEATRLGLSGGELFDGLQVWATDTNTLWAYDGSAWRAEYGRYGAAGSTAAHTCTASSASAEVFFDTVDYDPYGFGLPTTVITLPANSGGMYVIGARATSTAFTFPVDSHLVVDANGTPRRGGALGVASTILPQYCGLHSMSPSDTISVKVYNAGVERTATVTVNLLRVGRNP